MTNKESYTAGLLDGSVRISYEADRTVLYVRGYHVHDLQKRWGGSLRNSTLKLAGKKEVQELLTKWRQLGSRRADEIDAALTRSIASKNELSI